MRGRTMKITSSDTLPTAPIGSGDVGDFAPILHHIKGKRERPVRRAPPASSRLSCAVVNAPTVVASPVPGSVAGG